MCFLVLIRGKHVLWRHKKAAKKVDVQSSQSGGIMFSPNTPNTIELQMSNTQEQALKRKLMGKDLTRLSNWERTGLLQHFGFGWEASDLGTTVKDLRTSSDG